MGKFGVYNIIYKYGKYCNEKKKSKKRDLIGQLCNRLTSSGRNSEIGPSGMVLFFNGLGNKRSESMPFSARSSSTCKCKYSLRHLIATQYIKTQLFHSRTLR